MKQQDIVDSVIYVSRPHDLPETAIRKVTAWANRKNVGSDPLVVEASKLSLTIRQTLPDLPVEQAMRIAQLRFNPVSGKWTLWWCDRNDRWQLDGRHPPARTAAHNHRPRPRQRLLGLSRR